MESQQGISFTEFTYQLLQAYDFYNLYHSRQCTVQIGGSDQWGNILAGIDLIDRTRSPESPQPQGLTTPLLTTASGAKFGKSEGNAVWLDADLTSILGFLSSELFTDFLFAHELTTDGAVFLTLYGRGRGTVLKIFHVALPRFCTIHCRGAYRMFDPSRPIV